MTRKPRTSQTKKVYVTLELLVPDNAKIVDVKHFMYDLEWVGGCRHPDDDPMFDSAFVHSVKVRNGW